MLRHKDGAPPPSSNSLKSLIHFLKYFYQEKFVCETSQHFINLVISVISTIYYCYEFTLDINVLLSWEY